MDPIAKPTPPVPARVAASPVIPDKIARTAREFEAVFIGQVTKTMLESAGGRTEFTGGQGEEMFRGILAEEMGKSIAHRGGLGLAPAVQAQIIRMQGGAANGH